MNISAVHPSAKAVPVERAVGKVLRGEGRVAAVAKSAHVSESAVRCGLERVKQGGLATPMRRGKPLGLPGEVEERVLLWLKRPRKGTVLCSLRFRTMLRSCVLSENWSGRPRRAGGRSF